MNKAHSQSFPDGAPEPRIVENSVRKIRIFRAAPGVRVGGEEVDAFLSTVASRAPEPGSLVALDVSAVEFFSPYSIDALVSLHDRIAEDGGHFVVFGANGVVRDVLHLAGLDDLIGVFGVERAAVEHLLAEAGGPWH